MKVATVLLIITIDAVRGMQKYCNTSPRIERERENMLNALFDNQDICLIVNMVVTKKDFSDASFKDLEPPIENLVFPTQLKYFTKAGMISIRILSLVASFVKSFDSTWQRSKTTGLFCKIFPEDCTKSHQKESIPVTHIQVTTKFFRKIFLMRVCKLTPSIVVERTIKVQRELLILANKVAYNDSSSVESEILLNEGTTYNYTFPDFDMMDFEICDHILNFLNNCKEEENIGSKWNNLYPIMALSLFILTCLLSEILIISFKN